MQTRTVKGIKDRTVFFSQLPMPKKIAVIERMIEHSWNFAKWGERDQGYEWGNVLCAYIDFIRDSPFRYSIHE